MAFQYCHSVLVPPLKQQQHVLLRLRSCCLLDFPFMASTQLVVVLLCHASRVFIDERKERLEAANEGNRRRPEQIYNSSRSAVSFASALMLANSQVAHRLGLIASQGWRYSQNFLQKCEFSAAAASTAKSTYNVPEGHHNSDLSSTACHIGLGRRRDLTMRQDLRLWDGDTPLTLAQVFHVSGCGGVGCWWVVVWGCLPFLQGHLQLECTFCGNRNLN